MASTAIYRKKGHFVALFLLFVCASCTHTATLTQQQPNNDTLYMTEQLNKLTVRLMQQVVKTESGRNIWLSPWSIATALRTVYAGAEGRTAEEILPLTTDFVPSNNELLKTANALFIQPDVSLKKEYLADCKKRNAEIYSKKITAALVNSWAADHTNGKITGILQDPVPESLRMLIANAIWFKGDWSIPFELIDTHKRQFNPEKGQPYEVDMMEKTDMFRYVDDNDVQYLSLFYRPSKEDGMRYVMDIILPRENLTATDIIRKLSAEKLDNWIKSARARKVNLIFPKLSLSYERELNNNLSALGMSAVFSPSKADLSRMTDEKLFLGLVKQNSFLRIDECGTEAAAVTVTMLKAGAIPMQEQIIDFHVTRPYILILREYTSGTILFMGKIEKIEQ